MINVVGICSTTLNQNELGLVAVWCMHSIKVED